MGQALLRFLPSLLAVLLAGNVSAQEVLWQRTSTTTLSFGLVRTFGDLNGDGYDDVLVNVVANAGLPGQRDEAQFWSGRDGSLVLSHPAAPCEDFVTLYGVGDVDGDGVPDFAVTSKVCPLTVSPDIFTVYSGATQQALWSVSKPAGSVFGWYAGDGLDTDGDGRNEVLVIQKKPGDERIFVFNSNGSQRYELLATPFGMAIQSVAAVGDIDGDGGSDFVVGCSEATGRGAVILVSGRTGAILRVSYGQQALDVLGESVAAAGDVDGDGQPDYIAGSSTVNPRGLVVLFSGATGAPLQTWTAGYGHALLGRLDVDQDGVPDVITGSPGYNNALNSYGRIQAFSGRDGQFLWEMHNGYGQTQMAYAMASLGVQPGNPYPVIAYCEPGYSNNGSGRVTAVRTRLLGAGAVIGPGCGSGGIPRIGLRQQGSGSRITVSGALPGALAWIALAPATQTSYGGFALPLPLDRFGLVGCSLLVAPVAIGVRTLGAGGLVSGYGFADLPNAISPTGSLYAAQWVAIDLLSGQFALSPRHEFGVQ
jgi:hypothetical protein